eukprot:2112998-Rhodomonas_salina.1
MVGCTGGFLADTGCARLLAAECRERLLVGSEIGLSRERSVLLERVLQAMESIERVRRGDFSTHCANRAETPTLSPPPTTCPRLRPRAPPSPPSPSPPRPTVLASSPRVCDDAGASSSSCTSARPSSSCFCSSSLSGAATSWRCFEACFFVAGCVERVLVAESMESFLRIGLRFLKLRVLLAEIAPERVRSGDASSAAPFCSVCPSSPSFSVCPSFLNLGLPHLCRANFQDACLQALQI